MQSFTPKQASEKVYLGFEFADVLTAETLSSVVMAVSVLRGTDATPNLILSGAATITGSLVQQFVQGGVAGVSYLLSALATTSTGQVLINEGILTISLSAQTSALFLKAIDVNLLRTGQLSLAASTYGQLPALDDETLWAKLVASEADLSRRLGIAFAPLEIFPEQPTAAELTVLNGKPFLVEPGYDLPPGFFSPGRFGFFQLRQRPVISVISINLIYPNMGGAKFAIPDNWIRVDHKYGQVHLFPSAQMVNAPLSIMTMQAMGAGYNIPHMIRVRYTAGLSSADKLYPDIVDLVKRMAVLRVLHDSFLPQSGSISADGLSESLSTDISKYQDAIESQIENLKQSLLGPIYSVF